MIAVIFEVRPTEAGRQVYLDLAAQLGTELDAVEGFISIERFKSLARPDVLLSLSFWRDEEAVTAWRNRTSHRAVQGKGRAGIFADYRLRVASVLRDYGLNDREQAPTDSRQHHEGVVP